jgi:signal peptidase I
MNVEGIVTKDTPDSSFDNNDRQDEESTRPKNSDQKPSPRDGGIGREIINIALIAILIVLPIRLFIAQPFIVSGSSMKPTFHNGDYLVVDQLTYHFEDPKRNDVIVFHYPNDPSKFFIKRVIGLPGETLTKRGSTITVFNDDNPKGFTLDQSYLTEQTEDNFTITLKDDEYFVMGDNRDASSDSRVWGPLPAHFIVGHVLVRLLPLSNASILPGRYDARDGTETPQSGT